VVPKSGRVIADVETTGQAVACRSLAPSGGHNVMNNCFVLLVDDKNSDDDVTCEMKIEAV
jgi:hypothetical protein